MPNKPSKVAAVNVLGSRATSDRGLILIRELDERLGLEKLIEEHLSDSQRGLNKQFTVTSLQRRLVKTGGRLIKHTRHHLLLVEGHLHRRLFGEMLRRIYALPVPSG